MLSEHQRQIGEMIDEAHAILDHDTSAGVVRLAHLRWMLVRSLRAYQLFKHTELFDPLERGTNAQRAGMAAAMKLRCIAIGEDYTRHVQEWALLKAHDDWNVYRRRAGRMLDQISDHLHRELADATTLLNGVVRTRG